jgi:hypothetical protein
VLCDVGTDCSDCGAWVGYKLPPMWVCLGARHTRPYPSSAPSPQTHTRHHHQFVTDPTARASWITAHACAKAHTPAIVSEVDTHTHTHARHSSPRPPARPPTACGTCVVAGQASFAGGPLAPDTHTLVTRLLARPPTRVRHMCGRRPGFDSPVSYLKGQDVDVRTVTTLTRPAIVFAHTDPKSVPVVVAGEWGSRAAACCAHTHTQSPTLRALPQRTAG